MTHLHTLEHVGGVLETGRGGVERERCVGFDFGRGPSRGGMERRDGHVITEVLLQSQSQTQSRQRAVIKKNSE
jgi:hypothetical protein